MKLTIYLLQKVVLIASLVIASVACAQDAKKVPTKTSVPSKETVIDKKTVIKGKAVVKKKPAVSKPAGSRESGKKEGSVKENSKKESGKPQTEEEVRAARRATQRASEAKAGQAVSKNKQGKPDARNKQQEQPDVRKGQKPQVNARKGAKAQPAAEKVSNRYIALKTNIPFLAVAVQNLALEVQVHKHITIDFPVMWSISDIERKHALRTIAFQPEGRWWLKAAGTGHFFGIHAHAAWFNAKWEDNRYQSGKRPLMGAGISYGYKLPLSRHWGAEFNIGAGYANMKYNTYYNIENGAQLDTRICHYWGITRAGLSLVYRF